MKFSREPSHVLSARGKERRKSGESAGAPTSDRPEPHHHTQPDNTMSEAETEQQPEQQQQQQPDKPKSPGEKKVIGERTAVEGRRLCVCVCGVWRGLKPTSGGWGRGGWPLTAALAPHSNLNRPPARGERGGGGGGDGATLPLNPLPPPPPLPLGLTTGEGRGGRRTDRPTKRGLPGSAMRGFTTHRHVLRPGAGRLSPPPVGGGFFGRVLVGG